MTSWEELYRFRDWYYGLLGRVETLEAEKKELLSALKEMVHLHQHGPTFEGGVCHNPFCSGDCIACHHERAEAAIAKAEGGEE